MTSPQDHAFRWLAALLLSLLSANLLASSGGITGRSSAGCLASGCHGYDPLTSHTPGPLSPAFNYTSSFTANTYSVLTNSTINLRFSMSGSGASRSGFNMSATGGNLNESLTDAQKIGTELTHNTASTSFTWGSTLNSNLRWTAPNTTGTYTIYVCGNVVSNSNGRLDDGSNGLCRSRNIGVHLTPVINGPSTVTNNISEDSSPTSFSRTFSVTNDADNHTLTWSILSQASDGNASIIGSSTGTSKSIAYTPDLNFNGSDSFVVRVSDSIFSDTVMVTVNVAAQPDSPEIVQSNPVQVNMSEDASPTPFSRLLSASDPDGGTLTWSIITPASNGIASVSGTGTIKAISYSPNDNFNGNDSFIVRVTDNTLLTDDITVNVNVAAQADNPIISEGGSTIVNLSEDSSPTPFNLLLNASDSDGGTLTWSISSAASNGIAAASGTGTSKTINYVPSSNYTGADSFVVRVTDNTFRTDSILVNVNMAPLNDGPVIISTPPASATEDTLYVYNVAVNDPDDSNNGSNLTYQLSNAPAGMSISSFGVINWTPVNGVSSSGLVTLTVADGGENGAIANNQNFTISVVASNDPPVITSSAPTSATEDSLYTYNVVVADPDDLNNGIDLSYQLDNPPSGMQVSATGQITWTPLEGVTSSGTVILIVRDGGENGASADGEKFSITVTPVNDSPIISSAAPITATEDILYTYSLGITDPDDSNNGSDLSFQLLNSPVGMNISSTGVISWTPENGVTTSGSVMVSVSDGGEDGAVTSNQNFTITVTAVNDAPQITSIAATAATEDVQYTYAATVTDPDDINNGTDISFALINAPAGMTVSTTGQITWTPLEGISTSGAVTLSVTDGGENGAGAATEIFSLNVTAVNDSPSITSNATPAAIENAIYTYQLAVSDPDDINNGSDISFALSNEPADMSVSNTGLISWTPPQTGVFNDTSNAITVSVSDGLEDGATSASQIFNITINPPDTDNDQIANYNDNCPIDANNDQLDTDTDGLGDVCDNDPTGSGLLQTFIVFTVDQDGKSGNIIFQDGGNVTVSADLDSTTGAGDITHDFLSQTQGELLAVPVDMEDLLDNTFEFDPETLEVGTYIIDVTIDNEGSTTHNTLLINIMASTQPLLTTDDTDGDGIDDNDPAEGFGDDDNDGIPNYRDNADELTNQLSTNTTSRFASLLQSANGTKLSIGDTASAAGIFAASITPTALENFGNNGAPAQNVSDDSYFKTSEILDFIISDIPQIGGSVDVVIPLNTSIRSDALYRKYTSANGWQDFVIDDNNKIASAKASAGICPPPGSDEYIAGLNVFDNCLQLTLQDGGLNDSDAEINGIIRDLGAIVIDANQAPQESDPCAQNNQSDLNNCANNAGSIGTLNPAWLLFLSLPVLTRKRKKLTH